ncbi:putative F-box domain-containing protein [Medicago truncatula]|uniref:Putative F-box domain-containing protein n=1 Tax=Medicago truncatula TaxID=3880 RepID=A0A396HD36_MEDTR|nr:putative F-box domain-containing protein [Medicago truncatula]
MESGLSTTGKKKHDTEDVLHSKLSEPQLISHILSFLPTTDAVRTSVLSKKWLNNWTSVTKLHFDDSLFKYLLRKCTHCADYIPSVSYVCDKVGFAGFALCQRCSVSQDALYNGGNSLSFSDLREVRFDRKKFEKYFENFVYKALLFTNNNSSASRMLEKFSFVIHYRHDIADLNIWISSILNRGVKSLKIVVSSVDLLKFSASTSNYLLNSTLLEELELVLRMFTVIEAPRNFVRFGHLKHLKLSGISFFEIKNCNWSSGKDVIVEASLLESILIQEEYVDIDDLQGQSIKFNALYLKEFSYCGYGISQQIYLSGCGFRSYASVKIILNSCENIATCFAFQLFQHFHQVNCIKLEGSKVGILSNF